MIVKIVDPRGAVNYPEVADVEAIRGSAPKSAILAIKGAIDELESGVKSGFESAAQDVDFLS